MGADGGCESTVNGRHRRVHVGLELRRAESAVVDPDVVDLALEPLGPHRVAADAELPGRGRDRAVDGPRAVRTPFWYRRRVVPSNVVARCVQELSASAEPVASCSPPMFTCPTGTPVRSFA